MDSLINYMRMQMFMGALLYGTLQCAFMVHYLGLKEWFKRKKC